MSTSIELALEAVACEAKFCTFVNFNDWYLPEPWEYLSTDIMFITTDGKTLYISDLTIPVSDITNIELYFTPLATDMCAVLEYGNNEDMIKFYRSKPS